MASPFAHRAAAQLAPVSVVARRADVARRAKNPRRNPRPRGFVTNDSRGIVTSSARLRLVNSGRRSVRASALERTVDYDAFEFQLADAPVASELLPPGEYRVVQGGVCAPEGFRASAHKAGLRASGQRADCCLVVSDSPATSAGCFTQNVVAAAPVLLSRAKIAEKTEHVAVLINAGQANAATGAQGDRDAAESAERIAEALGIDSGDVLVQSTGVIGKRIKMEPFLAAMDSLATGLERSEKAASAAATAMCTTDLARKQCAVELDLPDGRTVRVGAMGKGSGMIHPNMATMLGVLTCDAPVEAATWRALCLRAVQNSYNQISVDGDTSTNDTVVALANGAIGGEVISEEKTPEAAALLEAAVTAVCVGIAKSIAWDGEGATCLLQCACVGAATDADARTVARSVVCSSLAKSAVFGHDPNWGRLAAAAGYSGVQFDQNELDVTLGPHALMRAGQPLEYDEKSASEYLREETARHGTVEVEVRVGRGDGEGVAWGCDLTYDYVKINAEYTT